DTIPCASQIGGTSFLWMEEQRKRQIAERLARRPEGRIGALDSAMDSVLEIQNQAKQQLQRVAMAAAPIEVLPPCKRQKKNPSCLGTSPVLPATSTADWSSLQLDIVRRIADSFLATNDIDCYMDLRTVCHSWRYATDDPKENILDYQFLPRRWIILDEVFQSGTRCLLVNTATGRILHKELPLLSDYYIVTTTLDGFFVLADRRPPHAARVFNPLTGGIIPFTVPVPPEVKVTCSLCFEFASPMLTLLSKSCCKIYISSPHSIRTENFEISLYGLFRRAVKGDLAGLWWLPAGSSESAETAAVNAIGKISNVMKSLHVDPLKFFSSDPPDMGLADDTKCFLMDFGGQLLATIKGQLVQIFRYEAKNGVLLHLKSIGNHAIFLGHHKCLAVDTDMFPLIEANCVYYTEQLGLSARIRKCNIKDEKVESISEAVDFVKQEKQFVLVGDRPFTIIQLLASYTINIRDSELALHQIT
uniref:KIB1-4 beta-propeller domain-containing protein n=1 Tax=Aegilops tauschii subsp. strangulata TaxID=200361 RepID=A0A453GIW4_AEGTS